jgi:hypothetical protein
MTSKINHEELGGSKDQDSKGSQLDRLPTMGLAWPKVWLKDKKQGGVISK